MSYTPLSLLALLILQSVALLHARPANAQIEDLSSAADPDSLNVPADDAAIDEVIVRGERHPLVIRRELNQARDFAIDIYNELNDDDRFDVECEKVAEIGTQLRRRRCRLRIDLQEESTSAEDYEFGFGLFGRVRSPHYDEFVNRIMRLANDNPRLLEQLVRTKQLNLELTQAKD